MYKNLTAQKDKFLLFFFIFLGSLLLSLIACLFALQYIAKLQIDSANDRYVSYLLADELRQSSDNLTKMVRLYVVTGNKKYRDYFNEILAIRNGQSPRPEEYHLIYWDLVTDDERPRPFGKAIALRELMLKYGFTNQEFSMLKDAKDESDDLAKMEVQAMNAIEGKFDDGSGSYDITGPPNRELAIKLVFGPQYMKQKARIMKPLQRFFESVEARTEKRKKTLDRYVIITITTAIVLSVASLLVMLISILKALKSLSGAIRNNERLLLNILPSAIADRLKAGEEPIVDEFDAVSVLFADIVGFTQLTSKIGAQKMVSILNELFGEFDAITEKYQVEKIKTIGDSYMAVSGVPHPVPDHAIKLASFALEMKEKVKEFAQKHQIDLNIRIGMSYGHIIAGIIGHKKFVYDLWGDVVNIANRMESHGVNGEIQITEKMAVMLQEMFNIEEREEIEVKGKGKMKTFLVKGRKTY
jgi:adenylate cyclase